jgi:hypothetical protein
MRIVIKCLAVVALGFSLGISNMSLGLAQGNGNSDHGCVTGNPSPGSECNGGPNDNQGKPGGGVGCSGGSNSDRAEPCGRADDDGTLNNQGNVPGCTSQGNAVNHNPHCGGGNEPPPTCQVDCGPPPCESGCTPPPGGCVSNCGETPPPPGGGPAPVPASTTTGVAVVALPSTGMGSSSLYSGQPLAWLLLAGLSALVAGMCTQRRSSQ